MLKFQILVSNVLEMNLVGSACIRDVALNLGPNAKIGVCRGPFAIIIITSTACLPHLSLHYTSQNPLSSSPSPFVLVIICVFKGGCLQFHFFQFN